MKHNKEYSIFLRDSFRKRIFNIAITKFGSQQKLADYLNSKIKSRHIMRRSIGYWIKGRHYFGYNLFIPIGVVKELCLINKINLKWAFKNAIKFNRPWFDPRNKKFLIRSKKMKIIKKNGQEYLDIYSILPKETLPAARSKKNLPLFAKKDNYFVQLWSESSWRPSKIKLRRFIKINELFFTGAAVYASEGLTKTENYNDCIWLGNSEPAVINFFLRWLDSFLNHYKLSFSIDYNGRNCNEKNIRDFWNQNILFLKESHRLEIRKKAAYNSALKNNFGVLKVRVSNTVLKTFTLKLLDIAKKLALKKKKHTIFYLRSLLACEGCVYTSSVLKEISIGCSSEREKGFIRKLLKKMELNFCERKEQFKISGWNRFFTLYKADAFKIKQINSNSKKENFLLGFKNHQKTQRLFKLRKFKNKDFTAKKWQNVFGLKKYISAHKFLNPLIEEKILLFYFKKNVKYYYINSKNKPFLESIWRLRNYKSLII